MSVKRLIVTIDPASINVSEFCRRHGISRAFFYETRRRYAVEGDTGLEPRSRAPRSSPSKTPVEVEDRIVELRKELDNTGLDAGPATIRWHLEQHPGLDTVPSVATIWRILTARGFITPEPRKRPNRSWQRFEADRANELWQIDGTNWVLPDDTVVKIINIVDDHTRVVIASRAHRSESTRAAQATFLAGVDRWGIPERLLSDQGRGFAGLDPVLAGLGVARSRSRPYHPETCGKVERFHQTLKHWLDKQPATHDMAGLQSQLDTFAGIYNTRRPHRSLGRRIPAEVFATAAKSGPTDRPLSPPARTSVHQGVVTGGAVRVGGIYIAVGAEHNGQTGDVITTGTRCDVFIGTRHIRTLTIDPTRRRQPLHPRPGRPRKV